MHGLSKHILSAAVVTVGVLFAAPSFAAHHDGGNRHSGGQSSVSRHSGGHAGVSRHSSGHSGMRVHSGGQHSATVRHRERLHDFRAGERHGTHHALQGDRLHNRSQHSHAFNRGFHSGFHGNARTAHHGGTHAVRHAGHRFHGDVRHFNARDRAFWSHGGWRHTRWHGRFGWWWVVGSSWYFYDTPAYPYPLYVSGTYYGGGDGQRCYDEDGSYRYGNDYDGDGYCDDDGDDGDYGDDDEY